MNTTRRRNAAADGKIQRLATKLPAAILGEISMAGAAYAVFHSKAAACRSARDRAARETAAAAASTAPGPRSRACPASSGSGPARAPSAREREKVESAVAPRPTLRVPPTVASPLAPNRLHGPHSAPARPVTRSHVRQARRRATARARRCSSPRCARSDGARSGAATPARHGRGGEAGTSVHPSFAWHAQ